jgi:hypothetical protein
LITVLVIIPMYIRMMKLLKMFIIYRSPSDNTLSLNVLHIQQGHRKHFLYVEYLLTRISEVVSIVLAIGFF